MRKTRVGKEWPIGRCEREEYSKRPLDFDLSNAIDRSRRVAQQIVGQSVLDLACGAGQLANVIDDRDYLGIDASPSQLRRARRECKNPNAEFLEADITRLPDSVGRFDCVVLGEVLEHFEDPTAIARIALDHARMRVIVTVPQNMGGGDHVWQNFSREDLEGIFGREARFCEQFPCTNHYVHWIAVWEVSH